MAMIGVEAGWQLFDVAPEKPPFSAPLDKHGGRIPRAVRKKLIGQPGIQSRIHIHGDPFRREFSTASEYFYRSYVKEAESNAIEAFA